MFFHIQSILFALIISYCIQKVNTLNNIKLNIYLAPYVEYNQKRGYMKEFKPVKVEKTVISIRLDTNTLKEIDEVSVKTDISRNELIVQCIDFALKHLK